MGTGDNTLTITSGNGEYVIAAEDGENGAIKCGQGALRAVRYNVDGEYLLTCGADRSIKLWNISKSLLLSTYMGHSGEVLDARGSCDNAQVLSGSVDKNVALWDVSTSRMVRRWRGHNSGITCVSFNEESTLAISGSQDTSVKCWDVRSRANNDVQTLQESTDAVTSISVTNHSILVGSADGWTRLYDLRQGMLRSDCVGGDEAVTCVQVSRDMASHLVSVADETIKLMDKDTGQLLATYKGHTNSSYKDYKIEVDFDCSDTLILATSPFGQVFVWDLLDEKVIQNIVVHASPVVSLHTHPTRAQFVAAASSSAFIFNKS